MAGSPGQFIPFLHPALAWSALAAGAIPVLIHLWNRRRYRRVPWAAMRFLLAANRRSARRMWLERVLLLLLRVAIITLFGLAVARPYLHASSLAVAGGTRVHRIIVLDNSLSMSALVEGDVTRFDRARSAALRLLDSFSERDGVSLVTLASPADSVLDDPVYDRRFVRDQLEALRVTQRAEDVPAAIESVRRVLRSSDYPATNRAVYWVSDMPRNVWLGESSSETGVAMRGLRDLSDMVGGLRENLTVVRTGGGLRNLAVSRLTLETPMVGPELPTAFEAEIRNFGETPVRNVGVRWRRDGTMLRTEVVPSIESGGVAVVRATVAFPKGGTHSMEARVIGEADALTADDVRFLSVDVRATTPVLLVDGRPGSDPVAGEAFFLATALAPERSPAKRSSHRFAPVAPATRISPLEPKVVSTLELRDEALDEYRVLVLCNVGRLPAEQWARLSRFVRDGGGLLVTAGDLVEPDHYNTFGFAAGEGLLPVRVAGAAVDLTDRDGTRLSNEPLTHLLTGLFREHPSSGVFTAQVNRFLPVEPDLQRAEVVLRFEQGAPALVLGTYGAGRVAWWSTSVNLSWSNLPAKGDFVPLMYHTVAWITPREGVRRNLHVGDTLWEPLAAARSAQPIRATLASGVELPIERTVIDGAYAVAVGPLDEAGLCRLNVGVESIDVAVNTDPVESDLRPAAPADFATALNRPFRWMEDSEAILAENASLRATEVAFPLFYLIVAFLFCEVLIAWRFGSGGGDRGA